MLLLTRNKIERITDSEFWVMGRHRHQPGRKYMNKELAGFGIDDVTNRSGHLCSPFNGSCGTTVHGAPNLHVVLDIHYMARSLKYRSTSGMILPITLPIGLFST